MRETVLHWIDGTPTPGVGDLTGEVFDPATGQVTKDVVHAVPSDIDTAVASANVAFAEWRRTSLTKRAQILFNFRELVKTRVDDLAELITAEHGKALADARGEVIRGLEVVEYACGIAHLLKGGHSENVSTSVDVHSVRQPLGVVAVVTPFNFPAMVPMWFFPIAIAAGNAVILKPSERTPSTANRLAELWAEAGLPAGVFNVVHGDRAAVDALLRHRGVAAVSFVGSTPVARSVYERAAMHGKRVQALGGAKNHLVVMPDSDLDVAADAAVAAAFGSAGQRCMAVSALIAVEPAADDLIGRIRDRAVALRVGDGLRDCDIGPLITRQQRDRVAAYIDAGEDAGAKVVVDGRSVDPDGDRHGFWLGPTVLDNVNASMTVYTDEIFGPVLSVMRAASLDDALALVNANPYGNGAAIFTNHGPAARRFQNEVEAGMVGVNVPVPVPMAYYSFGGWKASLFGDTHAHGADGVQFFTRGKVVTTRWHDVPADDTGLAFPVMR